MDRDPKGKDSITSPGTLSSTDGGPDERSLDQKYVYKAFTFPLPYRDGNFHVELTGTTECGH